MADNTVDNTVDNTLDEDLDLGIEKDPGSKKKLILLIAGAVLLLSLGGGITWWFVAPAEDQAATAEASGEEAAPEEAEELVDKGPALYHPFDPVFVVNLPPGGTAQILQVGIEGLVRSEEMVEFLQHNDPMIRHGLLELLATRNADQLRNRTGKEALQAELLAKLQGLAKRLKAPGKVEAIYFTSFVMQ